MKVYSYIRFSSKAQASGDSLRRQTVDTAKWAARHGYELDEQFTFRDLGVSAYDRTNLRSGALGLFLKAAQQGKIAPGSILAIEALDRLTRAEPLDAFRLLSDIVSCKISIVTVSDERVYDEASLNGDFASLMLAAALLVRGHEESKRKSERLKAHYSARRDTASGRIGHGAPHWLNTDGQGWSPVDEHVGTILEIFELASQGLGATAIANRFNETKRSLIRSAKKPGTNGWHASRIAHLLHNRAVIGEYQPHSLNKDGKRELAGEPIPGHYPVVVPEELFWRVQALISERTKHGIGFRRDEGYSNVLNGMLCCGYCGGRMYLDKKGSKRENVARIDKIYYGCSKAARHASDCVNRINYPALLLGAEARPTGKYPRPLRLGLLPALFEHLLMRGEQLNATIEQAQEVARQRHSALTGELAHVETRKTTLIDSLENGLLTASEVQPRLDRIRSELAHLQAQLDTALKEMTPPDVQDMSWIEDSLQCQMEIILPVIMDASETKADERAALRTRLLQRVQTIYLYRECARIQLRNLEPLLFIALEEAVHVTDPDEHYPLPVKAL